MVRFSTLCGVHDNTSEYPGRKYKATHGRIEVKLSINELKSFKIIDGIACFHVHGHKYKIIVNEARKKYQFQLGYKTVYITSKKGIYAHGWTYENAKKNLENKIFIFNKDKKTKKRIKRTKIYSVESAIKLYRELTGACEFGCWNFVKSGRHENSNYNIEQILRITKNAYRGDVFARNIIVY